MSSWVDDFATLLFKRAVLAKEQATEVVGRYLSFAKRAAFFLSKPLALCVAAFIVCAASGFRAAWLYESLVLAIVAMLLALIVIALPLLVLSQAIYDLLPTSLREAATKWQRRGGIILFCGLVAVFVIRAFRLWETPDRMLTVIGIIAILWLGGALGWLAVSDTWRRVLATKLWITLIVIAIVTMLPGPAALIEELATWTGEKVQAGVYGVTRPTPQRYYPASAEDLQANFVDRGSGAFRLWYHKDAHGNYQFFKSKGFDESGASLPQASSKDEMDAMVNWQRGQDREREAAQREAEAEAVRQAAAAAEAREAARIASYIAAVPQQAVDYVVVAVSRDGTISHEVSKAIVDGLEKKGKTATANVFAPAFVCPDGFDRVEAGQGSSDLLAMGLTPLTQRLLLVRVGEPSLTISGSVKGVHTYSVPTTISMIDARNGSKLATVTIDDVSGAGVTEGAAHSAFLDRLTAQIAGRTDI